MVNYLTKQELLKFYIKKDMRKILLLFLAFISFNLSAQTTDWVRSFGGTESDKGISIGTDSLGYVYISGYYNTSADFDQINLTNNSPNGTNKENFVAKLDSNGNVLWALAGGDQSGGCCDGSAPMCFEKGDFIIGSRDVCLGKIHGCNFYMASDQFEFYKSMQLTIDVSPGRGSSFSLEIPLGLRFMTISRIYSDDEILFVREGKLLSDA